MIMVVKYGSFYMNFAMFRNLDLLAITIFVRCVFCFFPNKYYLFQNVYGNYVMFLITSDLVYYDILR